MVASASSARVLLHRCVGVGHWQSLLHSGRHTATSTSNSTSPSSSDLLFPLFLLLQTLLLQVTTDCRYCWRGWNFILLFYSTISGLLFLCLIGRYSRFLRRINWSVSLWAQPRQSLLPLLQPGYKLIHYNRDIWSVLRGTTFHEQRLLHLRIRVEQLDQSEVLQHFHKLSLREKEDIVVILVEFRVPLQGLRQFKHQLHLLLGARVRVYAICRAAALRRVQGYEYFVAKCLLRRPLQIR
mmetsp:Transcript_15396/g.25724  ORF Transcript_15396/g.25724 Transcript_15396/m.25724 type:complete len:239 (-) Transcript_15396:214-930(-)